MNIRIVRKISLLSISAILLTITGITGCNVANQEDSIDLEGTIVFSMIPEGGDRYQLFSINPDDTGLEQLTSENISRDEKFTNEDFQAFDPSFNSDGSKILMNVSGGLGAPIIAYMNAENRFVWSFSSYESGTDYPLSGENPRWSPDESKIIYWHQHFHFNNPIIHDLNTDENTSLGQMFPDTVFENKNSSMPRNPLWSPGGGRLVFVESNDIYVSDADGANLRRITNSEEEFFNYPVWHPENHTVAVRVTDTGNESNSGLYQLNVETDETELLVSDNDAGMSFLIPHAWSRDGNYILVTGKQQGTELYELKILDIDKKEFIQVYTSESSFWGADMFLELEN